LEDDAVLTPLPIDDEISSLSAILLNEAYYELLKTGQMMIDGIPVLSPTCLLPFKAKAWLDLKERKLNGEQVDSKNIIVYADDFVAGFQYKWEAENYYKLLKERMEKFGLQLEDSKSRLLQSGAYIARAKQKSGECIRLQTFDFLGFTFYCGRSRKGMPYIMPKTSSKKFRQKIRDIKVWLYANRDQPLKKLMGMLNLKLIGHYRYYGISFNGRMISNYKQQVRELLFKVLNRRSDRKSYTREGFIEMLKYYPLATSKIYVSLF